MDVELLQVVIMNALQMYEDAHKLQSRPMFHKPEHPTMAKKPAPMPKPSGKPSSAKGSKKGC